MKPQLGDIISNRYTLVSLLRSVPGLEAWKVNDRMLARDCQIFIVTDRTVFAGFEAISSSLVLSRNTHFTKVNQMKHSGEVPLLITRLDEGLSLNAYLGGESKRKLDYEAMRSIVGETATALQFLLDDDLEFNALSTDIVRITPAGVQIADAPLVGLLKNTAKTPKMAPEEIAVHQIAALLYAMVTGQRTGAINGYDLSALGEKVPEEFHVICERGLTVSYSNDKPTIPMVSLAELIALLGDWKPVAELDKSEIDLPSVDGPASISRVALRRSDRAAIVAFPEGLVQSQAQFRASKGAGAGAAVAGAAMAGGNANRGRKGTAGHGDDGNANVDRNGGNAVNGKSNGSQGQGARNVNNANRPGDRGQTASVPMANGDGRAAAPAGNASQANGDNDANAGTASNASNESQAHQPADKSRKWWGKPRNHEHKPARRDDASMDLHDLTAAEMADVFKSFDSTADDSIFPDFAQSPDMGTTTNPTMQFDFSTRVGDGAPEDDLDEQEVNSHQFEATGRIPMMDENGMEILPGDESARALEAEREAIEEANPVTPPSFTPKSSPAPRKEPKDIADARLFGRFTTKMVAIVAVVVLIVAALGVAVYALSNKPGKDHSSSVSNPWPDMNVDKVPFGGDADSNGSNGGNGGSKSGDKAKSGQHKAKSHAKDGKAGTSDKRSKSVPKPAAPANSTPFDIDKQEFLTNPAGQQGYGYYMHLSQPQDVYRFVVRIRSSGGNAFLIAGSNHDPTQGQQVAQFSFDASGTTDVKLKKKVNTQDFILWVPASSLPNNQLYIEKVQFF
ncbi:hypothetical protein PT282_00150 [Bifidobacterium sp. ESL0763]|uniref:hypothetical protein n=1 Tax=Bifidobacterium sp. ESL0763 TaxID=2983227 RepID=UPI0023F74BB8|nr:hypothetical protein [Bifidobacterium sp. ESL0763]MDF7663097.1 hypothetical protein [Bifidobacterium sp. ESL0763]